MKSLELKDNCNGETVNKMPNIINKWTAKETLNEYEIIVGLSK